MNPMSEIVEKLKLDRYNACELLNCPESYRELFYTLNIQPDAGKFDLIFLFTTSKHEFASKILDVITSDILDMEGMLYVAYPKKGNKIYPDYVHRDEIFKMMKVDENTGFIADTDYKFNRMVGFDDTFTVLGIKHTQDKRTDTGPSHAATDYTDRIDEVMDLLSMDQEALTTYQELTPGYQRDWARHVLSTNSDATRAKRLDETVKILKAGFKSINLYKQAHKTVK